MVALFTRCWSALFNCCVWVRSFHLSLGSSYAESADFAEHSSVLLRLLDVLVCLSVTPCATLSWFSMSSLLGNCSLVYSMLTHVLRVVCWIGQSLCTSLSCSGDEPGRGHERASRVFCFGLWGRLPPKLFEQSSALLLFRCCGHCRAGRVPRGQWALLDTDLLVLIDRSATGQHVWWSLPCTCARHTKCSRLTVRSRFSVVSFIVGFCATQFWHRPVTCSEGS